jgi:hypothetical protein
VASVFGETISGTRRASLRLISEFSTEDKRIDLIQRYNEVAGNPGAAVMQVQDEFISNRMEPDEAVAYIAVCISLIRAATHRSSTPNA